MALKYALNKKRRNGIGGRGDREPGEGDVRGQVYLDPSLETEAEQKEHGSGDTGELDKRPHQTQSHMCPKGCHRPRERCLGIYLGVRSSHQ